MRIARQGEGVTVIRCNDDEGFRFTGQFNRLGDCPGKLDRIEQGALRVACVMRVIDASRFDL